MLGPGLSLPSQHTAVPCMEPYRPQQPRAHVSPCLGCQGTGVLPMGDGGHPSTLQCPPHPPGCLQAAPGPSPSPFGTPALARPHSPGITPHPQPMFPAGSSQSPTRSLGSWARMAKVASWRHWHLVCAGRVSRVWQLSVSQFPKPASLINGTGRVRGSSLK